MAASHSPYAAYVAIPRKTASAMERTLHARGSFTPRHIKSSTTAVADRNISTPPVVLPLKSSPLAFDQSGDFSLIGKSLSFNILFGVNQLAVTLYIEDTASASDQFNI